MQRKRIKVSSQPTCSTTHIPCRHFPGRSQDLTVPGRYRHIDPLAPDQGLCRVPVGICSSKSVSNSYLLRYPTVTHLSPLMSYPTFEPHVKALFGFMYSALKRTRIFLTLSPVARSPLSS
jgi:hypothetical protein